MSNLNQFNVGVFADYLKRDMFLDDAGVVTLQRFDRVKYPKLKEYEKLCRGFFWVPEEVKLEQDKRDMQQASKAEKHIMTSNILRQTVLDSLQGKAPLTIFGPVASVPELEALLSVWGMFETNLHSTSYSHIIQGAYARPGEVFDHVHEIRQIVEMADSVGKYYNALHKMNCKRELGIEVDKYEHKKAIWMALHASYALEAIRFMASFATTFGLMENKKFIGNGTTVELILQDEMVHTEMCAWIINQIVKDDPDFTKIQQEMADEVYEMYMNVIREEIEWAGYLFQEGPIIGLNEKIVIMFIHWISAIKLKEVGIKYRSPDVPKTHPIPWYEGHVHLKDKQVARQEKEDTSYVIGVLTPEVRYEELRPLE
ncbi:ribonucleotide reductase of class Ia (aerobic) [Stenotrophomonas phage YB07]|uniref:ribonucleoside-diphosphate reductase n=1 Tax=Stenotrophomonas phage YB07 TaxID=2555548 RepID=A0A482IHH4_9CAUD|nr:ribonucleotide reductase of class Ia (aerobic) [Stenotrophomonas phage YB07]QBP06305.1 ribonucleotide reductase of class Ia (aerobic) [Stenotrophomonas phage YB07]